jgi:5'-deoxynucleotidase YfbR-like HD superfamily hydrolase
MPAVQKAAAPPRAWQRMLSGRRLDLLDPSPLDVEVADIAHGLARVARWNGQTRGDEPFSVAQHSLLVEAILAPEPLSAEERLLALLHDAPEYVIGDLISPFKAMIGGAYKDVESRLSRAIHLRFSLAAEPSAALRRLFKAADRRAAHHEAVALVGFTAAEAESLFGRHPRPSAAVARLLDPMGAIRAEAAFLERFAALDRLHAERR